MAAASGRAEPRRPHDVEPQVALAAERRLAGVEAHPDADVDAVGPLLRCVRALRFDGCGDRIAGARKGEEERVALRVDLDAAVLCEALAHQPPVRRQDIVEALAELLEERRRPLDITEDEGDGAAREEEASTEYCERVASSGV